MSSRVVESGCSASAGFWVYHGLVRGLACPTRTPLLQCACSPSALSLYVAKQVRHVRLRTPSLGTTDTGVTHQLHARHCGDVEFRTCRDERAAVLFVCVAGV
jgi:hypothetical protein